MSKNEERAGGNVHPDQRKLTSIQAKRLADLAKVPAKELEGETIARVSERLRWVIDPELLWFRKICGKVVKTDPVSGVEYPVPFATVQVEDTDCSLLGYFPAHAPWGWYFPFHCRREVIGTTKTDACGNFCVWIPRWDIDWVLHWRLQRHCYPIIFQRPDLSDLLRVTKVVEWPPKPPPGDPPPGDLGFFTGTERKRIADALGPAALRKLDGALATGGFGADAARQNDALSAGVFDQRLPPPLPAELKHAHSRLAHHGKDGAVAAEAVRNHLAARVQLDAELLKDVDLRSYIGPFLRCVTTIVPEWVPIFDVPDITFRVLQDVNGDGTEEQIYGEDYFHVRWDAGNIGPVTLEASPIAKAGLPCGPSGVPCGDEPAIVLAGWMPVVPAGDPLTDPFDPTTGYGRLTNRPHSSPSFNPALATTPGAAPLFDTVALLGCNKTDPKASHYRIVYEYSADDGASWSVAVPFVGLTWPLYRLDGTGHLETHYPVADADGWYPIALPPGPNPFMPEDVLIDWPTANYADGRYRLTLQLGTGGASVTSQATPVTFSIDNSGPTSVLSASWGFAPNNTPNPIVPGTCPIVHRGTPPQDVYFRVTLQGNAKHLRSLYLAANDCGVGHFEFVSGSGGVQSAPGSTLYEYWHTSVSDVGHTLSVVYRLPGATSAEGTYGFSGEVSGRAFNPSGYDSGQLLTPPWQYDPDNVHIWPDMVFSVINT